PYQRWHRLYPVLPAQAVPHPYAYAVDVPPPGDRDVAEPRAADERRVRRLVPSLPPCLDERVVGGVLACEEHHARFQIEGDVVPEHERAGDVAARADADRPPARPRLRVDRVLQNSGVRRARVRRAHSLIAPMSTPFTK